jgi:serine/threonine protein kinase
LAYISSLMANKEKVLELVAQICPELRGLPKDWRVDITADDEKRILFEKVSTGERTFNHPTVGGLPPPWILKIVQNPDDKSWAPMYYHRETGESTTNDPRYMAKTLALHSDHVPHGLELAAHTIQNVGFDLSKMQRAEIASEDLRHKFQIVHTIDAGDGTLGAMNGGVFVVRMKGLHSRIFIEKRFKPTGVKLGQKEIKMLRRVCHSSLTFYTAAFIKPDLTDASLYVEFCDRGSLEDMIKQFRKHSKDTPKPFVTEAFVWHAFTGLCDGLAYLQGGMSFYRKPNAKVKSDWVPILHRDIKPDNVLLRSRHTLGSGKYFYCVLSDFGLACEDREDTDPAVDQWQKSRSKLGTMVYWAPELLYDKFPPLDPRRGTGEEWDYFPGSHKHTRYSDLWALGCSIFNLCTASSSEFSHVNMDSKPAWFPDDPYMHGTACRVRDLRTPDYYSQQLRSAIRIATTWKVRDRPSPVRMIPQIERLMEESRFTQQGKYEQLPEWATKVHEYLSKAEKLHG